MSAKIRVLFVCLGNICRSPTAEGVFRHYVADAGLSDVIEVDSCGTAPFHIGKHPDKRAIAAAAKHDYDISGLIARQFDDHDYERFDYIIPMDHKNMQTIKGWKPADYGGELNLFLTYCANQGITQVPDPYHDQAEQFDKVLAMLERASKGLLTHICDKHGLSAKGL